MTRQETDVVVAGKLLYQLAVLELVEREIALQSDGQALSENGPFWRSVQAEITVRRGVLQAELSHLVPSHHFAYKSLFKIMRLEP